MRHYALAAIVCDMCDEVKPEHDNHNDAPQMCDACDWAQLPDGTEVCGQCRDSFDEYGVAEAFVSIAEQAAAKLRANR